MKEVMFNCNRCGHTLFTMDVEAKMKRSKVYRAEENQPLYTPEPHLCFYGKGGEVNFVKATDTVLFTGCPICRAENEADNINDIKEKFEGPIEEKLKALTVLIHSEVEGAKDAMRGLGDSLRHIKDGMKSAQSGILKDLETFGEDL